MKTTEKLTEFTIRLTPKERKVLGEAAREQDRSLASVIRWLIRTYLMKRRV